MSVQLSLGARVRKIIPVILSVTNQNLPIVCPMLIANLQGVITCCDKKSKLQ